MRNVNWAPIEPDKTHDSDPLERIAAALERISLTLENIDDDLGGIESRLYTEDGTDIVDVFDHALTDRRDADGDGLADVLHDLVTATYEAG